MLETEVVDYRSVAGIDLRAHVVKLEGDAGPLPATVFFHGGSFKAGTPEEFLPECRYLAGRGMVAATVQYRLLPNQAGSKLDCVADAQAAIRWVRSRADVDPSRVVAGGFSAGGILAAATALNPSVEPADPSCRPNALVLVNGVPWMDRPAEQVADAPPTLILQANRDSMVPASSARRFTEAMIARGNRCELEEFDGTHTMFRARLDNKVIFGAMLARMDAFLSSLGFLSGRPDVDERMDELGLRPIPRPRKRSGAGG